MFRRHFTGIRLDTYRILVIPAIDFNNADLRKFFGR
jgi:hypothetical protein